MNNTIRAGIIGGAGYTGGELLRLLLRHPHVEITFVHSESNAGKPVSSVHGDLIGETDMLFAHSVAQDIDVLFLCTGHGKSDAFLKETPLPASVRVIDLSQDFRLQSEGWVYGLPELNHDHISQAQEQQNNIANPGCFATCIQLGLLPLAHAGLLAADLHTSAITGSTGAGQSLSATSHFSWRSGNTQVYKAFTHQHLAEIGRSLAQLQPSPVGKINFIPYRGNFTRGIIASSYTVCPLSQEEAFALYREYYAAHPFVHVVENNPDIKQVVNTNKCLVYLEKHEDMVLVVTVLDNLLKGASGQAVQNMNLVFGLDETAGLLLKPVAF